LRIEAVMRLPTPERSRLRVLAKRARFCALLLRSSILDPKSLSAALACAASFALPAHALDYPKLKSGLWEMQRESDRPGRPGERTMMCLDDSVQREMFDMGAGAMQGMCSKHDFRFSGNRATGDFVCDMGGTRTHAKSTMVLEGNSAYRTEIDTTYDPPLAGRASSRMVVTARNLGPCRAGMRPGDLVLPNGMTMNMHDMYSGAHGAPPGAPPGGRRPGMRPPPTTQK
jgi:uncharacterized protein DUF3617